MEQFHRTAQPSETWQLLVDLHNVDATERADAGTWAVTNLLCKDSDVLPLHMVERTIVEDVAVCRLSDSGASHVNRFIGLYATLYPGARRPLRSSARATTKTRPSAGGPEMFLLPGRPERLVVPQPMLESLRAVVTRSKSAVSLPLSNRFDLLVSTGNLGVAPIGDELSIDIPD
ncbi:hypothetical protein [Streptomyces olivaceoviridis]